MATITGTWRCVVANDRLRRSSQAFSVIGSQAWVFGGELVPRKPVDNQLDLIELLTPTQGSPPTQTIAVQDFEKSPSPRVGTHFAVLGNEAYLFSGRGGLEMTPIEENGALWRYSPDNQSWDMIEPANSTAGFPEGRSYHATTSDGTSTIYIHAGCPQKGRLSDLWSFDVASKTWTELPSAPGPARGGASITFRSGKLYRMNGFDGATEQGGAVDVFDIGSNAWSTIAFQADGEAGPEPRSVCTLLPVSMKGNDGLITLLGERDPSSLGHEGAGRMLGDVWAFDLETTAWNKVQVEGDRPASRGWFDADVMRAGNGKEAIVVHGGLAKDNSRLGDVWTLSLEREREQLDSHELWTTKSL